MLKNERYTKCCKRLNNPGHAHELTFSCYRNQPFLLSSRTCQWLVESIEVAKVKYSFSLWAYVFMPTHVHLVICPKEQDYSVSKILSAIKRPVAIKAIAYIKQQRPDYLKLVKDDLESKECYFWQRGGGYDRNLVQIDSLIKSLHYIHNNPVRKKLVESPQEWYYSSAAEWEGQKSGPLSIDKQDWPLFCSKK